MTTSLRALSDKNRFDEARKYPGQLSDALLFNSLIFKGVGETMKCVDKLCNLPG
ncbi:type III secretion system rspB [Pseudomonas trivialis]|uniref:Type III secretion system rspB n=1 Tax=Pseudomonas trivialis TaxID=200450 RepID=A0A0R2ZNL5_9PSED|nr:type III secretion system rspB [Pseudomonas trivialis]